MYEVSLGRKIWLSWNITKQFHEIQHSCLTDTHMLQENWKLFSNTMKTQSYLHQRVPLDIIDQEWQQMDQEDKSYCVVFQELSLGFILKVFETLSTRLKEKCFKYQKCLHNLNIEDLPSLLTHDDSELREYAKREFDKRGK